MIDGLPVTHIGDWAFSGCDLLTNVTIPDSVTSINYQAFSGCTSLISVTIGNRVTSIGGSGFFGCTSLSGITVGELNSVYGSADGVLLNKSVTALIRYPMGKAGSYSIPHSVTTVGHEAFSGCSELTNVTLPSSVIGIGQSAFAYCTKLVNVTLPESVRNIQDFAFGYCMSLSNVAIPNGVRNVGGRAYFVCGGLTNLTIGNSVTNIGNEAFFACSKLVTVTIPQSVINIEYGAFERCASLTGVYFMGNAPNDGGQPLFIEDGEAILYYLPGTTGWGPKSGGRPTVLWNPQVQINSAKFGGLEGQFGFNITGADGLVIVVEACTDLAYPSWSPVGTNTLTGGSSYFSGPQWTDRPNHFYRLRAP